MDECGADCFDCHSRDKLINTPVPEHQKLKSCIKCHKDTLKEILPKVPNNNFLNIQQK
jgi:cytochrome c553